MCQQGCSRPYWKPSGKGIFPLQSLIFLAGAYTNCQNAAYNACSENAKGSLHRCVAQTSFRAEMQKKRAAVSSAFPRSARRGWKIAMQHALAEAEKNRVVMNFVKQEPTCYRRSKCLMLMILRRGCKKN